MNELEDIVSQQDNALAAVNDQLTTAQQDNQQLRFQLDDTLRRAADERERSVMHTTSVIIMQQCCFHLLSLHTSDVLYAVAVQQANSITHSVCILVSVQLGLFSSLAVLIPHCLTTFLVLCTSQ